MTTLLQTNRTSLNNLKVEDMKSLTLRIVGILFIVFFNVTGGSAQNTTKGEGKALKITSRFQPVEKMNLAYVPPRPWIYTVLLAKNFPVIESVATEILQKTEEGELLDYASLNIGKYESKTILPADMTILATSKAEKKTQKAKIIPKINS